MAKVVLLFFLIVLPSVAFGQPSPCSWTYSSSCAVLNAYNLATAAYNAMLKVQNPTQLEDLWHEITYGNTYRVSGGFFVYVFDWADHCKAHGQNPMNVGIEIKDIINRDNFYTSINIGAIIRGAANQTGGGWARYEWATTYNGIVSPNRAWVRKIHLFETDYYIGSPYIDVDQQWAGMPCMQNVADFCSAENAFNLAKSFARDFSSSCNGTVVDGYLQSVNNQTRYRLANGFFISVVLFSGPEVASGYSTSFVGLTIPAIAQQLNIYNQVPLNLEDQYIFAASNHQCAWVSSPWTNSPNAFPYETYAIVVYAPAINIDYFVMSTFINVVQPLCPDCNCIPCKPAPVCASCPIAPEEVVTEISFNFKGLTCAGGACS